MNIDNIGAWRELDFFQNGSFQRIQGTLAEQENWRPAPNLVFRALELTQPDDVNVIFLGQDPYPQQKTPDGLAFSTTDDQRPRSLEPILDCLNQTHGQRRSYNLTDWARQGVLLLNRSLTVPEGRPNGHLGLRWSNLCRQILRRLSDRPRVLVTFGALARDSRINLRGINHLEINFAHPARANGAAEVRNSNVFEEIGGFLNETNYPQINWLDNGRLPLR